MASDSYFPESDDAGEAFIPYDASSYNLGFEHGYQAAQLAALAGTIFASGGVVD